MISDFNSLKRNENFWDRNFRPQNRKEIEKQLDDMLIQIDKFNSRFSDSGWCVYDSMSMDLIKICNVEFEKMD